jgi:glutamyl-tRNA reductase
MAREFFGNLRGATVLVISAGEAGKLTARALQDQGAGRILVTSRTYESAAGLAETLGGEPWPFARLDEALTESDIVVTSTAAPAYVLTAETVARVMARRGERPLFLVDIAVPRDIDPLAAEVPGVILRNMDDLQRVTEANLDERRSEIAKVMPLIDHEVSLFLDWWGRRDVIPAVAALRNRAEDIRRAELSRTLPKLRNLSDDDRRRIDAMTNAIVKKLLHEPLVRLKATGADNGYLDAIRELFALEIDHEAGHHRLELAEREMHPEGAAR